MGRCEKLPARLTRPATSAVHKTPSGSLRRNFSYWSNYHLTYASLYSLHHINTRSSHPQPNMLSHSVPVFLLRKVLERVEWFRPDSPNHSSDKMFQINGSPSGSLRRGP